MFAGAFLRTLYEFSLDAFITAFLNTRLSWFHDYSDIISLILAALTMVLFLLFNTGFFFMVCKYSYQKFPRFALEFKSETKEESKRAMITLFMTFFTWWLFLAINVACFHIFPINLAISVHFITQLFTFIGLCTGVYANWRRAFCNLVLEFSILFIFFSMYFFENLT